MQAVHKCLESFKDSTISLLKAIFKDKLFEIQGQILKMHMLDNFKGIFGFSRTKIIVETIQGQMVNPSRSWTRSKPANVLNRQQYSTLMDKCHHPKFFLNYIHDGLLSLKDYDLDM